MHLRSLAWILACGLALAGPAALAVELHMGSGWDDKRPWFCHGLDCPVFEVVESTDAYEVREYKEGVWATTSVESYNYALAAPIGFRRLFRYIDGENEDGVKIPMTSPVLTSVTPSCGPFCKQTFNISFFVPFHLQKRPPVPTSDDIEVTCTEAFTAYVASSGGFRMDDVSIAHMAGALADALDADGIDYQDEPFFVAGYDPPFRLKGRHTEVWFKKAEEDEAKQAGVAQA